MVVPKSIPIILLISIICFFSFLHIVNPGYKYDKEISGEARYNLVKNRYLEFKEDGIFIQDQTPYYYIYKIVDRDKQEFNGIVAAASAEDYEKDIIKLQASSNESESFKIKEKALGAVLKLAAMSDVALLSEE